MNSDRFDHILLTVDHGDMTAATTLESGTPRKIIHAKIEMEGWDNLLQQKRNRCR